MTTYRDILNKLLTLSEEQLDSEIFIINGDECSTSSIEIIVDDKPVYRFNDHFNYYNDFADSDDISECDCEKVLDENHPVIKLI